MNFYILYIYHNFFIFFYFYFFFNTYIYILDNFGPLILSEFTGVAGSLSDALMINPWDQTVIKNIPYNI